MPVSAYYVNVAWLAFRAAVFWLTVESLLAVDQKSNKSVAEGMRLLHSNCLSCHNAEKHKANLDLSSRSSALRGGESGAAIVPGKPEKSLLVQALDASADPHMPPKKQLSDKEMDAFRRWVQAGALWDEKALEQARHPREVTPGDAPVGFSPIYAISLNGDGTRLALGRGRDIVIHDLGQTNQPVVARWIAHSEQVRSLVWSADQKIIASGSFREISLWQGHSGQLLWKINFGIEDRVTAIRFTPDGRSVLVADGRSGQGGRLTLFNSGTGQLLQRWMAHADSIHDVSISSDGRLAASAGADKIIKVWELATHQEVSRMEGHSAAIYGVAFNPGGTELLSVGADRQLRLWDVKNRESVVTIADGKNPFVSVSWIASGSAYAADEDGAVWRFKDFKRHNGEQSSATAEERKLKRLPVAFHGLSTSNDGKTLALAAQNGDAYIMDPEGKLIATIPAHASQYQSNTSSPNPSKPEVKVKAGAAGELPPPSFVADVLPALAKAGCMAGSCHAKADGQNGFKLSVFSYDPAADFKEITYEGRGRRVFPAAPEESLLLLKPTGTIEHGGGERFAVGSETHQLLVRWIRSGLLYQRENEPTLVSLSVVPSEKSYRRKESTQLKVEANFSNGTHRDVTRLVDFISNDKELVQIDQNGILRTGTIPGETVVVARFMGQVAASRVTIPTTQKISEKNFAALPVNNFIDTQALEHFRKLAILPSGLCSDSDFLRRSSLDAIGALPSPEETRAFLANADPRKREKWINHLLEHPNYADFWANKWADLLRPNPDRVGVKSVYLLDQWLRESFRQNKPHDQFVRDILESEGSNHRDGPAVVYRDRREPTELTTMFSQLFLGTRMECAKCHHHPNEKWAQEDFYQFAAFFGPLKQKGAGLSPPISAGTETFYFGGKGRVKHPVTGKELEPRTPDGPLVPWNEKEDPRRQLVDWLVAPGNPFFARAAVNRVWSAFFGRGFVEPVDDFRVSNPIVNEPLLRALTEDFTKHGFDQKHLIRTILSSRLYQLSSEPNESNLNDTRNYSRSYRRRLPAEVLLDAVNDVTGVPDEFNGSPPGTRALQTWSYKVPSQFMDAFNRPNSSSDCPCERDGRTSVVQSLHMMNAQSLQVKLTSKDGRVKKLADGKSEPTELVTELYLAAFSRFPTSSEIASASAAYSMNGATRQSATEDVLWALLNSPEFVFNH